MAYEFLGGGTMIDVTFKLPEAGQMIKKLGLNKHGAVQVMMAVEAIRLCEPLVPFNSGMLKQSAHIEDGTSRVQCLVLTMVFGAVPEALRSLQISH